jgi:hypothetical protein
MTKVETLLEEARQLSRDDREWLSVAIAGTIEKDPDYDEACRREIQRRLQSIDDGTTVLYDEDEADALMFGPLDDD